MRYTLYLRTSEGDFFLQKGNELADVQKSHATVVRWIGQMNLTVKNPHAAMLVIAEKGWATMEARFVAGGRRAWKPLTETSAMRLKIPQAIAPTPEVVK